MKRLSFAKKISTAIVGSLFAATLIAAPARATTGDDAITVRDGNCDFAAAALGKGTATDPFQVGTPKQLAEISDCTGISFQISAIDGNGTQITYTADNNFGAGQTITIRNNGIDGYNTNDNEVKVLSATPTTFTIAGTETAPETNFGRVYADNHYYKLTSDIHLETPSSTPWNDNRAITITGAVDDGTAVTYTAENDFAQGDEVDIKGISPQTLNAGKQTILSADAHSFTVATLGTSDSYVSGGTAYGLGWWPIGYSRVDQGVVDFGGVFDGQNHTIYGLTIHNEGNDQALFSMAYHSTIKNLNLDNATVDTSGTDSQISYSSNSSALVGDASYTNFSNISIAGDLTAGKGQKYGLLAGSTNQSTVKNVSVGGTMHVHTGGDTTQSDALYSDRIGGAIGYSSYTPVTNATSTVVIDAGNKPENPDWYLIPGQRVGGLFGQANEFGIMSKVSAAGNITNGSFEVGGIVGRGSSGDIHDAFYSGDISFTQDPNYAYSGSYAAMYQVGGIFGTFDSGTVYDSTSSANITLDERPVTSTGSYQDISYIGSFGGNYSGSGSFVRDHATGNVELHANSDSYISGVGGFIGYYNCCGDITSSDSSGSVVVDNAYSTTQDLQQIGGFLGYFGCCGSIEDTHATGDVTVSSQLSTIRQIGGFIGQFGCCGGTFNSSSAGDVTVTSNNSSSSYVGGFVGEVDGGSAIVNSRYIDGQVTVSDAYAVGSLVGVALSGVSIQGSSASGRVDVSYDGNDMAGGLVGENDGSIAIENSYSTSYVSATPINGADAYNAGGLIGYVTQSSQVSITDSFASGHIRATNFAAGLVGNNVYGGMNIENSYFAGEVEASGTGATSDMISNGSWASTTPVSVVYNSSYAGDVTTDTGALPKTTEEMQTQSTFTDLGWNFGSHPNWTIDPTINNGYPVPVALSHATATDYNNGGGSGGGSSFVTQNPTSVVGTAVAPSAGDTSYRATVTWTDPTLDSGDAVSAYIVQAYPASGLPLETISRTKPATVTGLLIGTAYTFKVTVVTHNHGESVVGIGNTLNQAAAAKLTPLLPKIPAKMKPSKSALIVAKLGKTTQGLAISVASTTKKVCTVSVTKAKKKITGFTVKTKPLAKGKKSAVCTVSVTIAGNNTYSTMTGQKVNITVKK